jgi:hypothetical protein
MSSFLGIRKFRLIVRDFGHSLDFEMNDSDTMEWFVENEPQVLGIVSKITDRHLCEKSTKHLVICIVAEFRNELQCLFPYEQFQVDTDMRV